MNVVKKIAKAVTSKEGQVGLISGTVVTAIPIGVTSGILLHNKGKKLDALTASAADLQTKLDEAMATVAAQQKAAEESLAAQELAKNSHIEAMWQLRETAMATIDQAYSSGVTAGINQILGPQKAQMAAILKRDNPAMTDQQIADQVELSLPSPAPAPMAADMRAALAAVLNPAPAAPATPAAA